MDPTVHAVLGVFMRWIHIVSVVTLLGGFIYARFVLAPALTTLSPDQREAAGSSAVNKFRPLLMIVLATVLLSGVYNYATKTSFPPGYHMWMGIKLLLVLHIFASAILYSTRKSTEAKRKRTEMSIVISGLAVIAIAGYLRYLSLK